MYPEEYPQETPPELSFAQIREDIAPQLYCFNTAYTDELHAMLTQEPEEVDITACVEELKTLIHEQSIVRSIDAKRSISDKVTRDYPDSYSEAVSIETPKQYLKRSCADTSTRPLLRAARESAIQTSKTTLESRIAADSTHREFQVEHPDEQLEELVRHKISQTKQAALDTVDFIHDIYPPKKACLKDAMDDVYENLPPSINQKKAIDNFKPVIIDGDNGTLHPDQLVVTDSTVCRYVTMPATTVHLNQIENAFYKLNSDLSRYTNLSPESVAQAICKEFPIVLNEKQEAHLTHSLANIVMEELEILDQDIRSAYDKVPRKGRQPKTSPIAALHKNKKNTVADRAEHLIAEEDGPQYIEIETTKLCDVALNLPWCDQQEYEVKLMKQNGHELLFAAAMPPRAVAISKDLRHKTDAENGKSFDRMWQQIRLTELTNPNGTHAYIKKVKDADPDLYRDIVVLGTGNRTSNAKRIYYGKTSAARFAPLLEMVTQKGLDTDINILFLLAETDKQNQIDIYKGFGLSQAQARAQNVGSV